MEFVTGSNEFKTSREHSSIGYSFVSKHVVELYSAKVSEEKRIGAHYRGR